MKNRFFPLVLCFLLALQLLPMAAGAAEAEGQVSFLSPSASVQAPVLYGDEDLSPAVSTNLGEHNYFNADRWTDSARSHLCYDTDLDQYTRVEYIDSQIVVEQYSSDFSLLSQQYLEPELPLFGGFHWGSQYNFLIYGQENPDEDDTAEVIRIVKYDKSWNRLGQASLCGANTTIPFDAGSLSTAEYNGYLYIRTSHEMYASDDGTNHQSNLTLNLRIGDMVITDSFSEVRNVRFGYVSHSFNQYIRVDESNAQLVALDHGDAYPRSLVLTRYYDPAGQDMFTTEIAESLGSNRYQYVCASSTDIFPISGTVGDNDTGVSVGGFEISDSAYLTVGTTVDQTESSYDPSGVRNVFLAVTDKTDLTTQVTMLTQFTSGAEVYHYNPQLIKLSGDLFLIHWSTIQNSDQPTYYRLFVDAQGQPVGELIGSETPHCEGFLSDCQPILADGRIVWYMTANSEPLFFTIDPENPEEFTDSHYWSYTLETLPTETQTGLLNSLCYLCCQETPLVMPTLDSEEYTVLSETEVTCENAGSRKLLWYTPHGDGISFTVTIPALGHAYGDWTLPEGAVCGNYVNYYRTCSNCSNQEFKSMLYEHDYQLVTIEPTCTESGCTNQVCTRCQDTRLVTGTYTSATGHDWTSWYEVEPSTCLDPGLMEHKCETCGATETDTIGIGSHDYVVTESREDGCFTDGYKTETCTVCGDSKTTTTMSALGHWWETEVQEDGTLWICTRCGYTEKQYFDGREEVIDPGEEPQPTDPRNPFVDVSQEDFFFESVLWAAENGITAGYGSEDVFAPNNTCTRGQVVTFLWRAAGEPEPESAQNPFTDVAESDFFYTAVLWAVEKGITAGYGSEDIFYPEGSCTRGQVATFLHRYYGTPAPASTVNPFEDIQEDAFYYNAVLWAVEEGITQGYGSEVIFNPDGDCTRGQIVTFLYRAMQ